MQKCHVLLCFLTKRISDENKLWLGLIIPLHNMASTWVLISCFWKCGYLYGRTLTGIEFGRRLIEWVMSQVGGSVVGVWKKVVIMLDEGGEFWWLVYGLGLLVGRELSGHEMNMEKDIHTIRLYHAFKLVVVNAADIFITFTLKVDDFVMIIELHG